MWFWGSRCRLLFGRGTRRSESGRVERGWSGGVCRRVTPKLPTDGRTDGRRDSRAGGLDFPPRTRGRESVSAVPPALQGQSRSSLGAPVSSRPRGEGGAPAETGSGERPKAAGDGRGAPFVASPGPLAPPLSEVGRASSVQWPSGEGWEVGPARPEGGKGPGRGEAGRGCARVWGKPRRCSG